MYAAHAVACRSSSSWTGSPPRTHEQTTSVGARSSFGAASGPAASLSALERPRPDHPEAPRVGQVVVGRPAGELEQLVERPARTGSGRKALWVRRVRIAVSTSIAENRIRVRCVRRSRRGIRRSRLRPGTARPARRYQRKPGRRARRRARAEPTGDVGGRSRRPPPSLDVASPRRPERSPARRTHARRGSTGVRGGGRAAPARRAAAARDLRPRCAGLPPGPEAAPPALTRRSGSPPGPRRWARVAGRRRRPPAWRARARPRAGNGLALDREQGLPGDPDRRLVARRRVAVVPVGRLPVRRGSRAAICRPS